MYAEGFVCLAGIGTSNAANAEKQMVCVHKPTTANNGCIRSTEMREQKRIGKIHVCIGAHYKR